MGEDWLKPQELMLSVLAAAFVFLGIRLLPRLLAGVPFVKPRELKARLDARDDVLVVDVRNPSEFTDDLGHVPGALNVPLSNLSTKLEQLQPRLTPYADTPVYVVCRTANRAASAARLLKRAGLKDIKVVDGGMVRWKREGLPTSRSA